MSSITEIVSRRELIVNLTLRELRSRYKRSALGWTWSLLNPISTVLVYTVVFSVFFRSKPPNGDPSGQDVYALFLVAGLVPWSFFSGALSQGLSSLVANANLIKKTYFPREVIVLATVGSLLVTMLIELTVVSGFFLAFGSNVLPWLPVVLVVVAIQVVWVIGISLTLSVLNVYFRDMEHLIGGVLLQMIFYLTPILYPVTLVEDRVSGFWLTVYKANPVYQFVSAYRALLWDLRFPTAQNWAYLVAGAALVLGFGLIIFNRFEGRLAEEL